VHYAARTVASPHATRTRPAERWQQSPQTHRLTRWQQSPQTQRHSHHSFQGDNNIASNNGDNGAAPQNDPNFPRSTHTRRTLQSPEMVAATAVEHARNGVEHASSGKGRGHVIL
jgi:hypothetical protein